jgi:hypothetical protein
MKLYPDASSTISEVQNAEKLLSGIPDDMLTPMVRHDGVIYYVNELVLCANQQWFIPKRFFTRDGSLHASGHPVTQSMVRMTAIQSGGILMYLNSEWPGGSRRARETDYYRCDRISRERGADPGVAAGEDTAFHW